MIIISHTILRILTFNNSRVTAMALWPFIVFRNKEFRNNHFILNHEKIHHRQQLELLIIPYYIWYFSEYWYFMFKNKFKHHVSYMSISFEKEAYAEQNNLDFLNNRPFLNHLKYINDQRKKN